MILVMTNETVNSDVFDLHVIIHKAFDSADAQNQLKQSHINKQEERAVKNTITNINN